MAKFLIVEARFYDHRVWMLMIGYFALLLTVQLFMSVPGQFQPNVDSDNSQVQIEMVPGTTLEDTERVADRVAGFRADVGGFGQPAGQNRFLADARVAVPLPQCERFF